MNGRRRVKIARLKAGIEVRDGIIKMLMRIIADNKLGLPIHLISVMEVLYFNTRIQHGNGKENKETEEETIIQNNKK